MSLASPLLNAGTINANGGAVNGAIDNKNVFNVGGTVTSNNTFLNEGGASLNVNTGGAYTLAGLLTNAGSITVASNATLNASAGGLTNTSTGTVLNQGTISDVLNNAGAVTERRHVHCRRGIEHRHDHKLWNLGRDRRHELQRHRNDLQ